MAKRITRAQKLSNSVRYYAKRIRNLTGKGNAKKRAEAIYKLELAKDKLYEVERRNRKAKEAKEKAKQSKNQLPVEFTISFNNFETDKAINYVLNNEIRSYEDKRGNPCNYRKGCITVVSRVKMPINVFLGFRLDKEKNEIVDLIYQIFSVFFSEKDKSILFGKVLFFQRGNEIIGFEIITEDGK